MTIARPPKARTQIGTGTVKPMVFVCQTRKMVASGPTAFATSLDLSLSVYSTYGKSGRREGRIPMSDG